MYVLEFIDDNANIKHITEEEEIIFDVNKYIIKQYKKEGKNDYPIFVTKGKISDNIDFKDQYKDKDLIDEDYNIEFVDKYSG